ncbi:MAG: Gfo/Idh/MocA family oxidoreductase [Phycisphaerae bacterium]|nr:Gfo/Idh/MocA family oxidoreductase [Phycisphaerae bacterium]
MSENLAWGILGTGRIAGIFAKGLARSRTGRLVAVGSRSEGSAERFGQEFGVPRRHASYSALLADLEVEAVYISTPHPMHAEWAIRAAEAGKHVLCEKPLTLNHAEAMAVIEAARRADVFLMEAFMYRCHPQTARLVELIRKKAIGEVRVIQATFSFHSIFDAASRIFSNELGGGGILDVGCYCTSMARLIAGAATGRDFAEPIELKATGQLCPTGVDAYTVATLRFPGGILASLATGIEVDQESVVRVFGTEGSIVIPVPWIPTPQGGSSRILVQRKGEATPGEIVVEDTRGLYALEADAVAEHLARRDPPSPLMSWDDTLGNMRALDWWRATIGVMYESERPEASRPPLHGRKLSARPGHAMPYGSIAGLNLPVSRLVMGVDNQTAMPHAAVMFDDFFERGGNCFDTAHIYGRGACERVLGQWVKDRGIREQVVILDKGAHTPWCNPRDLCVQLLESLERLQTDYIDLYMLHRDNPEVPVGEFIDALNLQKKAGHIRAFGVSNWTPARIDEANDYASARDLDGIVAVSNQFSLARLITPIWAGGVCASDPASRAWHTERQIPLLAWSSQSRGFFAGRAHPDDDSDAEMSRCWYSEDNFRRLERARELAGRLGVLPINVALAYVLCQPFPTFALIGPRTLAETRVAMQALTIELEPQDLYWLNLDA